jgi:hypothetical protein
MAKAGNYEIPAAPVYGYERVVETEPRTKRPWWKASHGKMWVAVTDAWDRAQSNWADLVFLAHEYKDPQSNESLPLILLKRDEAEIFRGVGFHVTFYAPEPIREHLVRNVTRWAMAAKGLRVSEALDFYAPEGAKDRETLQAIGEDALANYIARINIGGEKNQDARAVAPFNSMVRWTMSLNYMTLMYIFKARNWAVGADPDTRRIVEMLWDIVHATDPDLWDAFYEFYGPPTMYGSRAMRQLRERDVTVQQFLDRLEKAGLVEKLNFALTNSLGQPIWDFIMAQWGGRPKDTWNGPAPAPKKVRWCPVCGGVEGLGHRRVGPTLEDNRMCPASLLPDGGWQD